jgi:4-hydroxybenzoate polyprenyltransferase/phosphoserine phosphatase
MRPAVIGRANLAAVAMRTGAALCVDLDGSLIRTDTLHESALLLLGKDPWGFARALLVLLTRGVAAFKRFVAERAVPRPDLLPYNEDIVAYLREEVSRGRRILLVTAADSQIAEAVAAHVGLFEAVLASDGSSNLKSVGKAERIRDHLGDEPFEYLGDSLSDLAVWRCAGTAIVVSPSRSTRRALKRAGVPISREFRGGGGGFRAVLRAMRIYQWVKNILIFAPLFLSHQLLDSGKFASAIQAFAAFCMSASAIYIVNDLLDLGADRQHPRKCYRPFAAGTLTIAQGVILALALLSACALVSLRLPPVCGLFLALYVMASLLYNVYAKAHLFLDVITLSGLYTVRLLIGGAAAGILLSPWTLGFSIFFFTSLASCKRLSEVRAAKSEGDSPLPGRAYFHADVLSLTALASSSGYAATLVMALYLNSPDVVRLYRQPRLMWLLVPLVVYWISRATMIANRGTMHDDPIVFAFRDRASVAVGIAAAAIAVASL